MQKWKVLVSKPFYPMYNTYVKQMYFIFINTLDSVYISSQNTWTIFFLGLHFKYYAVIDSSKLICMFVNWSQYTRDYNCQIIQQKLCYINQCSYSIKFPVPENAGVTGFWILSDVFINCYCEQNLLCSLSVFYTLGVLLLRYYHIIKVVVKS